MCDLELSAGRGLCSDFQKQTRTLGGLADRRKRVDGLQAVAGTGDLLALSSRLQGYLGD